jgi:hypothetical protein
MFGKRAAGLINRVNSQAMNRRRKNNVGVQIEQLEGRRLLSAAGSSSTDLVTSDDSLTNTLG